jgi:hypothetical protein
MDEGPLWVVPDAIVEGSGDDVDLFGARPVYIYAFPTSAGIHLENVRRGTIFACPQRTRPDPGKQFADGCIRH